MENIKNFSCGPWFFSHEGEVLRNILVSPFHIFIPFIILPQLVSQSSDVFSVHSNHMFYLVCLVFQGLVYAFRIHQDIAEKWFYFWSQCWIECSNGSEGFVRTTITFPCLWNCSHTILAKYVSAIGNVKFDVSFSCITEQHIATITMNPKRVHFGPASQILSWIFYATVGFLVMWF